MKTLETSSNKLHCLSSILYKYYITCIEFEIDLSSGGVSGKDGSVETYLLRRYSYRHQAYCRTQFLFVGILVEDIQTHLDGGTRLQS
jgi:hypothetical protein